MKSCWKSRMESVANRLMEAKKKRSIDSWLKNKDRLMSLDYFPKNKKRHKRSMKARDCGRLFGMPECDVLWVKILEVKEYGDIRLVYEGRKGDAQKD